MKSELVRFSDNIYAIIGKHLSLEEAQDQFGLEYDREVDRADFSKITSVKHWWIRYEFIGPDNCPDEGCDDPEPGESLWMLKEQEKRPKGVTRPATVINV